MQKGPAVLAFQGIHGAYSDVAARSLFGRQCTTLPCESFSDVFRAVEARRCDYGVIPIENSLAGSIHENYDLLLSHRLHIIGETHLRIEHVLVARRGASIRDLRAIRSHPQALAQCSKFFRQHVRLKAVPYFDTAGAAHSLHEADAVHTGAIASAFAAQLYGLKILRRHLENTPHNFTRFLVIARQPWQIRSRARMKTSIAFAPARNQVGILFRILGVFALRDIDLVKIESRPDPKSPFDYLFYVDLAGHPSQPAVSRALEHLQEVVTRYRLLGAYPVGTRSFHARPPR